MRPEYAPGLLVLGVALLVLGGLLIHRSSRRPVAPVVDLHTEIRDDLAAIHGEVAEVADDLTAIIAAIQDGHVQASPDVIEACDVALWEIQLGGAA